MFCAIVALCLFGGALAQVPSFGSCPKVETVQDFDVSKFMGVWYEAERYFSAYEIGSKCVTSNYSAGANNTVAMVNSWTSTYTGIRSSIKAVARVPDPAEPAKLKVKYPANPLGTESDYWVLGTDYENYAVVYSCRSLYLTSYTRAYILTREQVAPETVITDAVAVVEKNKLKRSSFSKTDQTDCE